MRFLHLLTFGRLIMTSNDDLRAAGLVIYRQVNSRIEYLLLQASYANNHWSPTKGHVDPGESDYDAAVRETHEEAGLTYHDYDIDAIFNYNMQYLAFGRPKLVFYWLARAKDPNVTLSHEHQDYKWCELSEALKIIDRDHTQVKDMLSSCEKHIRALK